MPKVTVIVPVYNVEKYLRRCIDSILKQTFEDFELICVNDCTPDGSQDIIDEYVRKYPQKVRGLKNEVNLGLGKTREHGLAEARGEYIMFIDSDDYIREDYLETYYTCMQQEDVDVVVGGYTRDVDGKLTEHKVSNSIWSIVTYTIACAKMYKKSFLVDKHLSFPDIRCGEDIYFSMSVLYNQATFTVMDYAGYYYYFNRKSITGSLNYDKNHEEFVAEIFRRFLEDHDLSKLPIEQQQIIEYNYLANMVNALITYGHGGGIVRMKKKYAFYKQDLLNKFPDYRMNQYVGIFKPKGQTAKIRLGVGVVMKLERIGLDKLLLNIISLV